MRNIYQYIIQVSTVILLMTLSVFGGQKFDLSIEINNFPDTIYQNQNIAFDIKLTNNDTGTFDDKVYINYMITDTIPTNFPDDLSTTFKDSLTITINPGNVYLKNKNLLIKPIYFEGNQNSIIIIWPTATKVDVEFNMHMQETRVEWPTGIKIIQPKQKLMIAPNPASGYIRFDCGDIRGGTISIYNNIGEIVTTIEIEHNSFQNHIWETTDKNGRTLPNGMYFVVFENHNLRKTGKLIIAR
ncbi:MAG: T9SS type A sorting domain-containing protein [Bacteroidia bacterium]|nr:T9SS type A sorting domain-containing protein [Bacteroidia bacterium]